LAAAWPEEEDVDRERCKLRKKAVNFFGKLLAIWFFALWPGGSFADELKLKVMDTRGKPLAGNEVLVTFFHNDERLQKLELRTDADGEAHFSVSAPIATRMQVAVVPKTNQHWRCNWRGACGISLSPEEALRDGVAFHESKKRARQKTNPGEILFLPQGRTFWQHLIGPLAK
jgi:hypothetical protein